MPSNYSIDGDYLVTSDPVIAAMVLGVHGIFIRKEESAIEEINDEGWFVGFFGDQDTTARVAAKEIRLPRAVVKELLVPVEGETMFVWDGSYEYTAMPNYGRTKWVMRAKIAANALTLGKTTGELRELLEWANGGQDE